MQKKVLSGIQQIGIGVADAKEAFSWYRQHFAMDIRIFEDIASADLMKQYTGNQVQERHAILAMNLQGGGGFEIWQFTQRTPSAPAKPIRAGDLGICFAKVKCRSVQDTFTSFKKSGLQIIGDLQKDCAGKEHFFIRDPFDNVFQVIEGNSWFKNEKRLTGGLTGAVIGVSDIDRSRELYSEILKYDQVVYDEEGHFDDLAVLPGGAGRFRRTLLRHTEPWKGGFCNLFGSSELELICALDRNPDRIYQERYWGDLGFIHLCFDVNGMPELQEECKLNGFDFTVDSSKSFDMGQAAGHFAYIEDPDGTLIEFIETHKVPISKKFGLYVNLKKRNPQKALPNWMVRTMSFNRVKD